MKVKLLGKQMVSYKKKDTGALREGMSVFYSAPKEGVEGECTDSIWLRKDTKIYNAMMNVNLSKPTYAEVKYEMMPGSRFPELSELNILQ